MTEEDKISYELERTMANCFVSINCRTGKERKKSFLYKKTPELSWINFF